MFRLHPLKNEEISDVSGNWSPIISSNRCFCGSNGNLNTSDETIDKKKLLWKEKGFL